MAKHHKKKVPNNQNAIAKWTAIGAWAIPASGAISIIKLIVKHFLYNK